MRPIRVLYTTHASDLTGAARSLLDLLGGLSKNEVEATVLLRKHGPIEGKLRELNIPYKIIPYTMALKSKNGYKGVWLKRIVNQIAARRVSAYIKREQFDLIHNNSLLANIGMLAARKIGIPYICHIREYMAENQGLKFYDEDCQRELTQAAILVIAISNFVAKKFQDWTSDERLYTKHDGINVNNYLLQHPPLFKSSQVNILMPGRIEPEKRQLDAVKTVKLLRQKAINAKLVIVGTFDDDAYLREINDYIQTHNLQENVEVKEFYSDIRELYSWADVSLMCSSHEPMGRVTVEGMLSGCLVIGAEAGATPEIISDGVTGLLYKLGEPQALAERIEYAMGTKQKMREIAKHGQIWAKENYDQRAYARLLTDKYRCIYEQRSLDCQTRNHQPE